jgi:hypothetical protein
MRGGIVGVLLGWCLFVVRLKKGFKLRFLVFLTVIFGLAMPVKGYAAAQQRFTNLTCKMGECVWYRLAVKWIFEQPTKDESLARPLKNALRVTRETIPPPTNANQDNAAGLRRSLQHPRNEHRVQRQQGSMASDAVIHL